MAIAEQNLGSLSGTTTCPAPKIALMAVLLLVLSGGVTASARGQDFTVIHAFGGLPDGAEPIADLVMDEAGNLYGTTQLGGSSGGGTVFKVDTTGKRTLLHSFTDQGTGLFPEASLILDAAGNLYGTTTQGGGTEWCGGRGCGVVFKLDTSGSETVLHRFTGGTADGCNPFGGLVQDEAGNLYGTTVQCGFSNYGTVFKVDTDGKETLLHSFGGGSSDGASPSLTNLLMDQKGNFYGITANGGTSDGGVLYKLSKSGAVTVLHSFAGGTADGCRPQGIPFMDKNGDLYGTTASCGPYNGGIVWKVSKKGEEIVLYSFTGAPNGAFPEAGVIMDAKGDLYGTTVQGGTTGDTGTVYELKKKGTLTELHNFHGRPDGAAPWGGLVRDPKGNLYGTAYLGGEYGNGTVWRLSP
jgi:uncharacterized repeat protein (TIGR03803 family)